MLLKIIMVLRLVAFMVLMYLALAWFVERRSTNPQGKIRAFFRIVCAPVAVPVSRMLGPAVGYQKVLVVSMGIVGAAWAVLIVLNLLLIRS
jgi:putative effector of murein hydrolase